MINCCLLLLILCFRQVQADITNITTAIHIIHLLFLFFFFLFSSFLTLVRIYGELELKRQQEDAKAQVDRCDANLARLKVDIAGQRAGMIPHLSFSFSIIFYYSY